jgi:hypothetical protein
MLAFYQRPKTEFKAYFSSEITLTDDQIDLLEEFLARFKKVNSPAKVTIIQEATDVIQANWQEDTIFNREGAETVLLRSSTRLHAYAFLRLSANIYITAPEGPAKTASLI